MNFPVFGDAENNAISGQNCASLIENGATIWSCVDRDPLGKIAYFSLPYRLSKDPVIIDHITLGLKILVFLLFVVVAARVLRMLTEADGASQVTGNPFRVGITVISVLLLAICINNIPVRLADMEAACCAAIAMCFALCALRDITERDKIPDLYIFLTCFFASLAGLFKQSFFVREVLMILAFALCLRLSMFIRLLKDWRVYLTILTANVCLGLQLLYVWKQFGVLGLTQPTVWAEVAYARQRPFVAMEIFTIPFTKVYMHSVPENTSRFGWLVYKVYYALVTTDPFVYGGFVKPWGHMISSNLGHWTLVYLTVAWFFAVMIASIVYGSRVIRFVTLVALFNIVFMVGYQHVEPRYHIFPKVLLAILAVYWTLRAWQALPFVRSEARAAFANPSANDDAAARQAVNAGAAR